MSKALWSKVNYDAPIDSYNGFIVEYDIAKANISALRSQNIIDQSLYEKLYNEEKHTREVYVGYMVQQNPDLYKSIQKGIIEAKRLFFAENTILDDEVIAIHNDSVIVKSQRKMVTDFGLYRFKNKGEYTQYLRLAKKIQLFYRYDMTTDSDMVEIKGISQEKLNLHRQPFLEFIINMQYMLSSAPITDTLTEYNNYLEQYMSNSLPIDHYRELNAENGFRVIAGNRQYILDNARQEDIDIVNKQWNFGVLRDLGKVIHTIYFNTVK